MGWLNSIEQEAKAQMKRNTFQELESRLQMINEQNCKVFMPALSSEHMPYREEIVSFCMNRGWVLTHWSVAVVGNLVKGYPVFEKGE